MLRNFLQIFKKGNNGALKILLLGVGIAMGLILIAKIYYEKVFDNFMDDPGRVYIVQMDYTTSEGEDKGNTTPGAIAPGIKAYSPAVEAATRATSLASAIACKVLNKDGNASEGQYVTRKIITADSSFFEIFTRKITGNDPKEGLNLIDHIYISRSYAKTIAANNPDGLIGNILFPAFIADGSLKFIIDGIFEDFPENSTFRDVDMIASLPTIGRFTWDGSNNWVGNDRYYSYVKLQPGYKAEDIDGAIAEMCDKNLPHAALEQSGTKISLHLEPLSTYNIKDSDKAQTSLNLFILAVLVLVASVLNYVLIAISAMVRKSKKIAVHKCYGASETNIYKMIFSETFVHIVLSVLLSCFIILAFRSGIEELVGTSISGLITPGSLIILSVICLFIFFVCGFFPGIAYARIPVASAFRRYKENSRKWKLILLFMQFTASAFLISLLAIVMLQYNHMINSDLGYEYKNLAIVNLANGYDGKKQNITDEILKLPFVEGATLSSTHPLYTQSGNNILLPGESKEYFNIADMYYVGPGYFKTMGIRIIDGRNFKEDVTASNEVLVSRSFVKKMEEMAGWKDGAIGKSILVTEHSQRPDDLYTICGVFEDYVLGTYQGTNRDMRPAVQFYAPESYSQDDPMMEYYDYMEWLNIRLKEITPQNLAAIGKIVHDANPTLDNNVTAYSNEIVMAYKDSARFRDSILIAGAIVLLITLIGLLGYAQDEVNRRRSEIAIRKINGATVPELLKLFLNNVIKLAFPAILIGCILAYFAAGGWLEMYTRKIALNWYIFVICGLITLSLVLGIIALKTYSAANANPVKNLKNE